MQQLTNIEKTPIAPMAGDAVLHLFRKIFKGQIVGNSGISIEQANRLIAESVVDAVAFGSIQYSIFSNIQCLHQGLNFIKLIGTVQV